MTTTVCDFLNQIITADTRWSCGSDGNLVLSDGHSYLVYCDDTGFDKITVVGNTALVTAGHGPLIADWKAWWIGDAKAEERPPTELDGMNVVNLAILNLRDNTVMFDAGQKQVLFCRVTEAINAFTSGSGAAHAASRLLLNGCAKDAVSYASDHDYCTGKVVSFADYKKGDNNLNNNVCDYEVITKGITERGYMMKIQVDKPNDVGVKVVDHPLAEEVTELFSSGQAVASAPVPGIGTFKWTEETNSKFEDAMKQVHELRAAN